MRTVYEIVRLVVLSPELVVVIGVAVVWSGWPEMHEQVANRLSAEKGVPEFMGALPVALVIASYKLGVAVLSPGDQAENKVLYEWSGYWALEARVYGSGFLCLICAVMYWVSYVNILNWSQSTVGAVAVLSVALPVVSVTSLAIARIVIRKIVTLYS